MRKFCYIFILSCLLLANETLAQKLILCHDGVRASDNPASTYVEYEYRNGVDKKDIRDYCIRKLSQPDFYSYRIDYTDDHTIKINGYTKKNCKGLNFNMLIEFGSHSVKVSAELYDKDGSTINEKGSLSTSQKRKKGKLGTLISQVQKKNRDEVESKFDEVIRSMMEMKIIMH